MSKNHSCCGDEARPNPSADVGGYVCYCSKVTEEDIRAAILKQGASSIDLVIELTGAMTNPNCAVNNPKGVCCYQDIVQVFQKYKT